MSGIYLHIPFCRKACHYCDFHFSTNLSYKSRLIEGLLSEIKEQSKLFNTPIKTIYFGGGTPSILSFNEISSIIRQLKNDFEILDPELTIECNPEDITNDSASNLRALGFNRISLGVQSFNDSVLKYINRNHTAQKALEAVKLLQINGFDNISLDLIYGLPTSKRSDLEKDLAFFIGLQIQHISVYSFTLEENTVFGNWHKKGLISPIDNDIEANYFKFLIDFLIESGFEQYEVSNFCKPGFESKHNSSYWKGIPYLGIGPGAHSFDGQERWSNISNNIKYMKGLEGGKPIRNREEMEKFDRINDWIITSLRTKWGLDLKMLKTNFNIDLLNDHFETIDTLFKDGKAHISNNHLILTKEGLLIADSISEKLIYV